MGYKSKNKQRNRSGYLLELQAVILDDNSRRSWILLDVKFPFLEISFQDWFHVSCPDGENLLLDYAFTPATRGIATDKQLVALLNKLTKVAITAYIFLKPLPSGNAVLIDRFHELDIKSHYTNS